MTCHQSLGPAYHIFTYSLCNNFCLVSQTGRSFITRNNERTKAINYPYIKSNFADHILSTGHKQTNLQTHKGAKSSTLEQFRICKRHKTIKNEILNDQIT